MKTNNKGILKEVFEFNRLIFFRWINDFLFDSIFRMISGRIICDLVFCPLKSFGCNIQKKSIKNNTEILTTRNCTATNGKCKIRIFCFIIVFSITMIFS